MSFLRERLPHINLCEEVFRHENESKEVRGRVGEPYIKSIDKIAYPILTGLIGNGPGEVPD